MAKNVVICSDGTGSTFDGRTTNLTRLVGCLAVDKHQVVIYDPGVGSADRAGWVPPCVVPLEPPPGGLVAKTLGLLFGYGLTRNVREMYEALARFYEPGDRVFLFGYSRGAFTVRALAGLLYRCGLPTAATDLEGSFARAWKLYRPMRPGCRDQADLSVLRRRQQRCPVHFMGLWDTVKSYGGLRPIMLPHLRHNPDVATVRHALALDERRAWFQATTWGRLDWDRHAAMTRLPAADVGRIDDQDILEVWFTGAHIDIGRGRITLRWMLGEAAHAYPPLLLNEQGLNLLEQPDPQGRPGIHRSWRDRVWALAALVPRLEIDNRAQYPVRRWLWSWDGRRDPHLLRRDSMVTLHATARGGSADWDLVEWCETRPAPRRLAAQRGPSVVCHR